jgi:zinc transport system substrate-binding protein
MKPRIPLALSMPLVAALSLTACGSGAASDASSDQAGGEGSALKVMTSFYPLQYVTEQVGGDLVTVESLTPPGAEPHDLELSPAAVASLESAGAVVYLSGFQPAVDDAIEQASPEHVLDVSAQADLESGHSEDEHAAEGESEGAHAEETQAGAEESGHSEEEEAGGKDLHFWLDPERLANAANAVADELGEVDPDNAAAYKANAEALAGKLTAVDNDFTEGLGTCENRTIVVSHEAYGYLTNKYELEQVGIAGLEPDTEPSPARLAEIGEVVKNEGVTTIFTESLVNPKVAETLAADLNIETAVLDPLEGLADESSDYEKVMRQNLEALRGALSCA